MNADENPFAQSEHYWRVKFTLHADAVGTAEEAFGDIALAVSAFETDEANRIWTFDLLFGEEPDMAEVTRRLLLLAGLHKVDVPKPEVEKMEQVDWLAAVARSFPPLSIGRFYVYGSHVEEKPPAGAIGIQVDAGAAFGSGEHGTTSCCLKALEWLAKSKSPRSVLDMGTGSGILAIAAAKLWKVPVIAVDLDPVAVRVTQENVRINQEQMLVRASVSDGYSGEAVKKNAPYDIIVANILARPLIEFAPQLAKNLSGNGYAVLSGLLTSQEQQVLGAHVMQGMKLEKRFVDGEWCTLVLHKK